MEETTYNTNARPFTALLEHEELETNLRFQHDNTYDDVVEEWVRITSSDAANAETGSFRDSLTKVQVNFVTGAVHVLKYREHKSGDRSQGKISRWRGREWEKFNDRKFDLNAPKAMQYAARFSFS